MLSTAAQIIVTVIPIVGIVTGGIVIFFFLYWNNKQKMLIIEKGQYTKSEFDINFFSLFAGLVLACIGICLVIFFILLEGLSYSLLGGLIPLSLGVSLLVFYIIRVKTTKNGKKQ